MKLFPLLPLALLLQTFPHLAAWGDPIHDAARSGDLERLRAIVDSASHVTLSSFDEHHLTPLHYAALFGQGDAVRLLLERGGDPALGDSIGATPLHYAAQENRVEVIRQIAAAAPTTLGLRTNQGWTPLHLAVAGDVATVQALLAAGATPSPTGNGGVTPLQLAARAGRTENAKQLLIAGAPVDAADDEGWTALHGAVYRGNHELIGLLIGFGADVDRPSRSGVRPIYQARLPDVAMLLVGAGAKVNVTATPRALTPLMSAAAEGMGSVVAYLIEAGATIDARDTNGQTALMYAVQRARPSVVSLLLKAGATADLGDAQGMTPLHVAAFAGDTAMVAQLLDAGTDINVANVDGMTPIDAARAGSQSGMIEYLRQRGGKPGKTQ